MITPAKFVFFTIMDKDSIKNNAMLLQLFFNLNYFCLTQKAIPCLKAGVYESCHSFPVVTSEYVVPEKINGR